VHFIEFLQTNEIEDLVNLVKNNPRLSDFVLKKSKLEPEIRFWIAEQIKCRENAMKKLPSFWGNNALFTQRSLEQATHESVSLVKTEIIPIKPKIVLDVTAGLGSDLFSYRNIASSLIYNDLDSHLTFLAKFNATKLGIGSKVQVLNFSANEIFEHLNEISIDLVLMDPDRRAGNSRFISMEEYSPNPKELEDTILRRCKKLLIKLSPMLSIKEITQSFKYLHTIYIISYRNEVKEISTLHSLDSEKGQSSKIICVDVYSENKYQTVAFTIEEEASPLGVSHHIWKYFYEPNKAIIKSGYADNYATQNNLESISANIPYYTSNRVVSSFMGRVFTVMYDGRFSIKEVKNTCKKFNVEKASLSARGFYEKAETLEKILKMKPGSDYFIFFYLDFSKNPRFCLTVPV
jgi:hypothetical protein